jgi:hypothetical protein
MPIKGPADAAAGRAATTTRKNRRARRMSTRNAPGTPEVAV